MGLASHKPRRCLPSATPSIVLVKTRQSTSRDLIFVCYRHSLPGNSAKALLVDLSAGPNERVSLSRGELSPDGSEISTVKRERALLLNLPDHGLVSVRTFASCHRLIPTTRRWSCWQQ